MYRLACFLLSAIVLAAAVEAQDDDVVRVDSSLVVINATISDLSGKPVGGLKRERFSVFEDGVQQDIRFFAAEETPFAAVILLDTSGSMEERVSLARSAAIQFLSGIRESDVVAVYDFNSKVSKVQDFSQGRDLDEMAFGLKSRGMTAMYDAIVQAAKDLSKRPERRKAIVVLSDGEDTFSGSSADRALKAALAVDAAVYTVDMSPFQASGVRRIQNAGVLRNFAERTGGRFVSTPGGAALREAFAQIVAELGTQYTIAYEPKNTEKDGKWRAIEVRVSQRDLRIRTRKGYHAPKL